MPQFTKGKWTYAPPPNDKNKTYGVFGAEGKEIILVALVEKQANARLIAEAPVMYELLNKAFHILGKNTANDAICREIDECLSRVDGAPVHSEEGKQQ